MSSDKETLLSMGFDSTRVEWALKATSNRGLQPAMDHILENEGKPVPDLSAAVSSGGSSTAAVADEDDEDAEAVRAVYGPGGSGSVDPQAKSIKCSECGKIFRDAAIANFHAEKSGHDQFEESTEEIKPLTEEEKKAKLAELREKMAQKRAAKQAQEVLDNKANEAIKRKAAKDMGAIKEDLKAKEAIKEAAQRKKDKIEDAKAKAAIKAQIEADKRERAEKAAREKALRQGAQPLPSQPSSAPPASSSTAGKDYKETRLQIRLATGGPPYTTTLPSDATLREVAEFLAGQTLAVDVDNVSFAQHFPRKQFSPADFSRTLKDLGLTPSAVLIAS
ncbi:ubiquitin-related domain-containing protein [Gautieria morchelliformis]|nr:ubiquitin-related domain-containing protein [Gautieria morchelliformis]